MTVKPMPLLIAAAFSAPVFGQTPSQGAEKVFHLTYVDTPQWAQEIVNIMRSIAEIQQVALDSAGRNMTVAGTADQVALAGWLLPQLDKPAGQPAPQNPPTPDYRLGGSSSAVARVFPMAPADTPRQLQEIVNALRSVFEIQTIMTCNRSSVIVARGTADQITGTEWALRALDQQPATPGTVLSYTYTDPRTAITAASNTVRIVFLANATNPQAVQEVVNSVRSIVETQRIVAYNEARALVMRDMPDRIAMALWMIDALDKPAAAAASQSASVVQYPMAGTTEVARVFYASHASTAEAIQNLVNQVRTTTRMQRVVACSSPQAVVLRGTTGQVAMAATLIQEARM
ncbi:MAG TPA: hypothetical protein VMH81_25470 [Bryobacteraceae bacterium]|nr:hypothetical protein [Bryobacteraceae bacterium]HUI55931.1 hypothetical protein [Bryobacteraceae bacterium]